MTNLEDLNENKKYFHLKFVEFLDFLCRVAILYHQMRKDNGIKPPNDIEDKVHEVLEVLWEHKVKKDARKAKVVKVDLTGPRKRKKKEKVFPEL